MKKKALIISFAVVAVAGIIIAFMVSAKRNKNEYHYETAVVEKGNISNSVTATGTVSAIITVDVGTQVSGIIKKLYVDFNSKVKKGEVLAEMDKTPLIAGMNDAEAAMENAKAQLTYQEANYNRLKPLYDKNLVSQSDYDQALFNYQTAKANLKSVQSQFQRAQINLNYATIYSPVDGTVLDRAVNEGQTVAAGFSTPKLFTIANDLTQMQVQASVDEADIGQVKNDDKVTFTVDAYPDLTFKGKVTQVRLEPVTSNNVVTYTVVIQAPNPDLKLMPGMTANITINTQEANDVLLIPSKALLFKPTNEKLLAELMKGPDSMQHKNMNGKYSQGMQGAGTRGGRMQQGMPSTGAPMGGFSQRNAKDSGITAGMPFSAPSDVEMGSVWVKREGKMFPAKVAIGINDDINAQVVRGLRQGDTVVISETVKNQGKSGSYSSSTARSPFMPTPPRRR